MTTKKNYSDIQCVLGTSVVLVISFFVVLNNYGWRIDSDNWKVLMLFILLGFLNVALPFLYTHGGLFTDTVTVNEEGIVFELRKDTDMITVDGIQ